MHFAQTNVPASSAADSASRRAKPPSSRNRKGVASQSSNSSRAFLAKSTNNPPKMGHSLEISAGWILNTNVVPYRVPAPEAEGMLCRGLPERKLGMLAWRPTRFLGQLHCSTIGPLRSIQKFGRAGPGHPGRTGIMRVYGSARFPSSRACFQDRRRTRVSKDGDCR